jgi:branched-chain amino acid transport system ATP-binding protein
MLLEVSGITVQYGSVVALNNVSFGVDKGHVAAIIGANGAGKSTILRTISGLLRPVAGAIRLNGEQLSGLAPHRIARLGISHVPEGRGIFGPLTVLENLEVALSAGQSKAGFSHSLEKVFGLFPRLLERLGQSAGTLSGGEQQMLAVGRALVSGAEVLLLDEPSMGLSPSLASDMFVAIRKINAEGATILLVEQNAGRALSIAHTAYVLETGNMVLYGSAAEVRNNPKVIEAYLGG